MLLSFQQCANGAEAEHRELLHALPLPERLLLLLLLLLRLAWQRQRLRGCGGGGWRP